MPTRGSRRFQTRRETPVPMHAKPASVISSVIRAGLLAASLLCVHVRAADDPVDTVAELATVRQAIEEIDAWLDQASTQRPQYEQQLHDTELQLQDIYQQLTAARLQIADTEFELVRLEQQSEQLETQLTSASSLMQEQLRSVYMNGQQSQLKLILSQEDPAIASRMLYYHQIIARSRLEQIEEFRSTLEDLAQVRQQLDSSRQLLTRQQDAMQVQNLALADLRSQRQQALRQFDEEISAQTSRREQLIADRSTLEALLEQINRAVESLPSPRESRDFATLQGSIPWPANGSLLSEFDDPYGDGSLRRQGVVIAGEDGAPVRAVHGGRIVFADWLRGYGLMTIIDHGDGYLSLYGYNRNLELPAGSRVNAGDIVAKIGNSGGQTQTGVYFEIRHNGRPVNPLDWCEPAPN